MLTESDTARLFEQYPVLRGLPSTLHNSLIAQTGVMRIPQDTVVFDENQACGGFPLLLSGCVRVIKAAPNGRELLLYTVEPGESCILTSSCLLGNAQYHARGVAAEAVEMAVLPPAVFKALTDHHEPFRNYIFGLFSERMADLMQLVAAVAFQKLDQRLAALLSTRPNPIRATHQELADELGSVREIISRLLKQFAAQGWIRLGREQIEVLDSQALHKLNLP